VNMGTLADIATHYAYWRLNSFTLKYVPALQLVESGNITTNVAGTAMIAYGSDPDRAPQSAPSTGQLVDCQYMKEFNLCRAFSWTVKVKSFIPWLESTHGSTFAATTSFRSDTAGFLTFASSTASTLVSGVVGRIMISYDVQLKNGDGFGATPTLEETKDDVLAFEQIAKHRAPTVTDISIKNVPVENKGESKGSAPLKKAAETTGIGSLLDDIDDEDEKEFLEYLKKKFKARSAVRQALAFEDNDFSGSRSVGSGIQ